MPTPRERTPKVQLWARVAVIASRQWGVIDDRQLARCGVSTSTVSRWVAEGRLHRVYLGVYAVGHPTLPVEGLLTAALFRIGPGATLSHATAAWWWGLLDEQPPRIDISIDRRRVRVAGIRVHHRRELDRTWHGRLPVTSVAQTLLDLAANASRGRTRHALAEAEFQGLIDLREVEAMLGRGRPGSATLRDALHRHMPELARTRSKFERRFLELCESAALPPPEVNVIFCGYRVDALWRDHRVAVELDGHKGHRTPAQLESDHQRDLVLRHAGFVVLRYTWRQLRRESALVVSDLRAALDGASARLAQ